MESLFDPLDVCDDSMVFDASPASTPPPPGTQCLQDPNPAAYPGDQGGPAANHNQPSITGVGASNNPYNSSNNTSSGVVSRDLRANSCDPTHTTSGSGQVSAGHPEFAPPPDRLGSAAGGPGDSETLHGCGEDSDCSEDYDTQVRTNTMQSVHEVSRGSCRVSDLEEHCQWECLKEMLFTLPACEAQASR